ncbi:MAG: glycosyltransferase family 9 protein [Candidatus Eremiobacteraeota bacterium]|nr:glycosyltransferase family 9 protein [Candidatus Eremiobacteraeota bacterium]
MPTEQPLLVLLRPLGLGDFLTAVPAYRALARAFPGHRRVLAAPIFLEPLARLTSDVDAVVDTAAHEPLGPQLQRADIAIDLHGKGPRSHRVLLAASPKRMIAWHNAQVPQSRGMPRWRQDEHEVSRWCRLLSQSGVWADPGELDVPPPPLAAPAAARGATLIHPGAASPARCWPPDRWAAVARAELQSGRRVVFTGDATERARAELIAAASGAQRCTVLAGQTDLLELASLVANAATVLCADTGVAHLATALGTPSIVLFGPTSPAHWGPPADRPHHRVLWSGRTGDPHGLSCDRGLLDITPADVLAELTALRSAHPVGAAQTAV